MNKAPAVDKIENEIIDVREVIVRESKLIPNDQPFYDATAGPFEGIGIRSIKLIDAEGTEGEAPINAGILPDLLEYSVVPTLLHQKIPYPQLYDKLYWSIRNCGFRSPNLSLIGGIDIAMHDIVAKRRNISLSELLGARRNWSHCYLSGGSIHLELAALLEELQSYLEDENTHLKIKVGDRSEQAVEKAIERVEAVRDKLGFEFELAVDFNQALTADQTIRFAKEAEPLNILWIEEPVHVVDLYEIQKTCENCAIPIAYGESEYCSRGFRNLLHAGVRHFEPIPMKFAGVADYQTVQATAVQKDLFFSSGGYSWLSAEFICAGRESDRVEYLQPLIECVKPYLHRYARLKKGRFEIPESTGMAFAINWEKIEKDGLLESIRRFDKGHKISIF